MLMRFGKTKQGAIPKTFIPCAKTSTTTTQVINHSSTTINELVAEESSTPQVKSD